MRNWLLRHPFLTIGLVTLALFFAVEALRERGATDAAQQLAVPLRLVIIPMYLVWLLLTMLYVAVWGPGATPTSLRFILAIVQFTAGLVPYIAVDYFLQRWRDSQDRRLAA